MKKISLLLAVLIIVLASCNNKKVEKQTENTECKDKQECQMTPEEKAAMEEFRAKWDNWVNLEEAEKTALIAQAKENIAKCEAKMAEMEAKEGEGCCKAKEGEGCCKAKEGEGCKSKEGEGCKGKEGEGCKSKEGEGCKGKEGECCKNKHPELTPEQKAEFEAKKAEFEAKWAQIDSLSIEEQKALIDAKMECMKHRCHGDKCAPASGDSCKKDCDKSCDKKCDK
ncbi:MAG: hypothetical protein PHU62_01195 [Bacteroidales bacterium]|jgi:hypothetical protein|nr:hypothetical protein [Bacteroidales bacterium]MDD2204022.1 hypothetical protein [Bacteroidales bacterium]MDD3152210.1 hypothetical protein [Bacteroidales bacterium]MDD3913390.1 hypothetical protein [Bacteroidales bacterium]MDD4633185.1 hypothetical protein [Bacteroidales bacterium]